MSESTYGLRVEKHNHAWLVVHAGSGLPAADGLRQRRFADEAMAELLATDVDWTLPARDIAPAVRASKAAMEAVARWHRRARQDDLDPETFEYYSWFCRYGQEIPSAATAAKYRAAGKVTS